MNVGQNTTLGDGNVTEKLVQLLIVSDGELKMTGDDTRLLVVTGSVASQLENFGSEVLKNGSEVDGSTYDRVNMDWKRARIDATYQHQHVGHSYPCGEVGEHDRQGKLDQPWKIAYKIIHVR